MNEHAFSYSPKELLHLAQQTAHNVTQHDPAEAYREMGRPMAYDLGVAFQSYAAAKGGLDQEQRQELDSLLVNGFDATRIVITSALLASPHTIRKKEALTIAGGDDTVQTLSIVALQSANTAFELVERAKGPYSPFVVHRPSQSIRFVHENYQSVGPKGCTGALLKDGETISPVFRNFVRWSGAVAVHCMYKRRFTNSGG